ncbi:hypothetical protein DU500_16205 [Haloplanus rubicundus]|uniref:DUF5658 domain-containing protein n=1 Tax=Haloplanus rubicundus TaxID=1547898 RepID=A0A345EGD8_9EURY|nr:hypothetical protein [Haloplanus rubicundus]AXG07845.1 hypothetical protein DU500_16205 [Haloplanus rubicundus]AXG11260.1 hypothetical protein DU484_16165 [Haloplanus rubicundus]
MNSVVSVSLDETPFDPTEFSRLWFLATLTYGVGDIVTTLALVGYSASVNEGNVLLRTVIESFGLWGLIGMKLLAFLFCLVISLYGARDDDSALYYGPPAMLALVGAFTTVYNLRLLIG